MFGGNAGGKVVSQRLPKKVFKSKKSSLYGLDEILP